jgi:hypothetical protein
MIVTEKYKSLSYSHRDSRELFFKFFEALFAEYFNKAVILSDNVSRSSRILIRNEGNFSKEVPLTLFRNTLPVNIDVYIPTGEKIHDLTNVTF